MLGLGLEPLNLGSAVPAHDVQVVAVVLVLKEELRHVEGIAHHDELTHDAPHAVATRLQVLEGVLHQVELGKRAGDGRARIARHAAVGVLDLGDVVVLVGLYRYPVLAAGLGGLIVVG